MFIDHIRQFSVTTRLLTFAAGSQRKICWAGQGHSPNFQLLQGLKVEMHLDYPVSYLLVSNVRYWYCV